MNYIKDCLRFIFDGRTIASLVVLFAVSFIVHADYRPTKETISNISIFSEQECEIAKVAAHGQHQSDFATNEWQGSVSLAEYDGCIKGSLAVSKVLDGVQFNGYLTPGSTFEKSIKGMSVNYRF